jgi:hypothetical protein
MRAAFIGLMLIRRLGLALGMWLFVRYALLFAAYQLFLTKPNGMWYWDKPDVPYVFPIAWGAAIIAFFLPRPHFRPGHMPGGKPI